MPVCTIKLLRAEAITAFVEIMAPFAETFSPLRDHRRFRTELKRQSSHVSQAVHAEIYSRTLQATLT